ncbi:MAG TPA: hypothetical protein DFI00_02100 [Rhodospirillaceae bacterium]|nr:hypothetical protein [Alphaproteobacteria bacterium]OUT41578.1 MAG: hypothetical protein CBB62_04400 [Micavibrio sp. TMED2]HCI46066.1 hypothetical protein [Rhodospirillaceae bacterium]MAS46858.1 hypothetical protein [Alphaproteobacteria bacterium]MAX94953.1 hypothetical protein [Alphaproteobacteria bacterium]|tara:strand:+ start:5023 stop:6336 length:1314 start_codon:yes stop_codon:yes gene_type:complete
MTGHTASLDRASMTGRYNPRAVVSTCFTRTFTHREQGTLVEDDYPLTLLLSATDAGFFDHLTGLAIDDYRIELNHERGSVHHLGRHSDPLFLIADQDGRPALEINLYDMSAANLNGSVLELQADDGQVMTLAMQVQDAPVDVQLLSSELFRDGHDCALTVSAPEGGEIIWQRMVNGRFVEQRQTLAVGEQRIAIPPAFADWFGICLTSRSLYGAVEHKHMIIGELGLGSGRWFLDFSNNALLAPRMADPMRYRSLLVLCRSDVPSIEDIRAWLENWDEVEIVADAGILAHLEHVCRNKRISLRGLPQDELLVLGGDSAGDDFAGWLLEAVSGCGKSPSVGQWLGARVNRGSMENAAHYGIGYAYDHGWAACRSDERAELIASAERFDRRRFLMKSMPCSSCPQSARDICHNLLPRPFDIERLWVGGNCLLQEGLLRE